MTLENYLSFHFCFLCNLGFVIVNLKYHLQHNIKILYGHYFNLHKHTCPWVRTRRDFKVEKVLNIHDRSSEDHPSSETPALQTQPSCFQVLIQCTGHRDKNWSQKKDSILGCIRAHSWFFPPLSRAVLVQGPQTQMTSGRQAHPHMGNATKCKTRRNISWELEVADPS